MPKEEFIKTLLTFYSVWLEKQGYLDTDWFCEEPKAVEEFYKYYEKNILKICKK